MRAHTVLAAIVAAALLGSFLASPLARTVRAETPATKVYVTVEGRGEGSAFTWVGPNPDHPDTIVVPGVPAILNITLRSVSGSPHTFTIRSGESSDPIVDVDLPSDGFVTTVEFTLWAADRVAFGSRNETAQVEGGGVKFVCLPHDALRMWGYIVVGGVEEPPAEPAEKGVFLRAYWIGLLGMAGTLLLIGISYFVIKSSSRHYRDHHEHIRRGGP